MDCNRVLYVVCLLFASVAAAQPHENLNAVTWMQTAAEYRAACLQTFRAAEASMLRAIHEKSWTAALEQRRPAPDLPPAVIIDLDETVLDNSAYQAKLTATGGLFNDESWQIWVAEKRAGLVPAAGSEGAFEIKSGKTLDN